MTIDECWKVIEDAVYRTPDADLAPAVEAVSALRVHVGVVERRSAILTADRANYSAAISRAVVNLTSLFFELDPKGDLPSAPSFGGQLAQCVESLAAEYKSQIAALTAERDKAIRDLGEAESKEAEAFDRGCKEGAEIQSEPPMEWHK